MTAEKDVRTTSLRQRMIDQMRMAGLARNTQTSYVREIKCLAKAFNMSPDRLEPEQVRSWHLARIDLGLSESTTNVGLAALKFFYGDTLHQPWMIDGLRMHKVAARRSAEREVYTVKSEELTSLVRRGDLSPPSDEDGPNCPGSPRYLEDRYYDADLTNPMLIPPDSRQNAVRHAPGARMNSDPSRPVASHHRRRDVKSKGNVPGVSCWACGADVRRLEARALTERDQMRMAAGPEHADRWHGRRTTG